MGFGANFCRMPLYGMDDSGKKVLMDAMKAHGLL